LIGDAAKNQAALNPRNTVFDAKYVYISSGIFSHLTNIFRRRLIGRRFDDPSVKKDVQTWPFKVVDQGGNPLIQVEYLGETKTFSPQEISSMVLNKVNSGLKKKFASA